MTVTITATGLADYVHTSPRAVTNSGLASTVERALTEHRLKFGEQTITNVAIA